MKCNNESVRKTLALTLTLSPRRGDSRSPRWEGPLKGRSFRTARPLLPLPGGEGRGEGERLFPLPTYGLAQAGGPPTRRGSRYQTNFR